MIIPQAFLRINGYFLGCFDILILSPSITIVKNSSPRWRAPASLNLSPVSWYRISISSAMAWSGMDNVAWCLMVLSNGMLWWMVESLLPDSAFFKMKWILPYTKQKTLGHLQSLFLVSYFLYLFSIPYWYLLHLLFRYKKERRYPLSELKISIR